MTAAPIEFGPWPNRMIFGPGTARSLGDILSGLGVGRALIVCGRTIGGSALLDDITAALGPLCGGVFRDCVMQTPLSSVTRAHAMMEEVGADAVVSIGGGSAIDTGKGLVLITAAGGDYMPFCRNPGGRRGDAPALPRRGIPHIAIPTTAGSSSETLPTAGLRDESNGLKLIFRDTALIPDMAILDPETTVLGGPVLTAASGLTVIARFVEALYSSNRQALSSGLALQGLRMMRTGLPRSLERPDDLAARGDCLLACVMSGISAGNALPSLAHAIGHIVGGRYGSQHGMAHGILLAPVMRLLLPAAGDQQRDLLYALGDTAPPPDADAAGARAADLMGAFVARLPVPQRLRDLGVAETDLADIADHVGDEFMMKNAPRAISRDEIMSVLRESW